jgi:hypothetical protein
MSANDVRLDAYVSQRNQVNYDIYTINNLPTEQPEQLGTNLAEVSTDLISRQDAIDMIRNHWSDFSNADNYRTAKACVDAVPPIRPKRGKWTADNACSECGCQPWFSRDIHNYNFCPNCGADMRER